VSITISDLIKRLSLKRLLIAVPIALVEVFVGGWYLFHLVHGQDYYAYIAMVLIPTAWLLSLLWFLPAISGKFSLVLYALLIFVMQSALVYGLLSIPEWLRTKRQQ
jgi:hypothetical protein